MNFASPFLLLAGALLLVSCASTGGPDPEAPPQATAIKTEEELSGFSGKYAPEAERAFAEARVLWKRQLSSLAGAEVCSDPEKAVALLDKAIAREPSFAEAYARRGLAKSELGDREAAFDDITAAIRLRSSPEHYAYRGLVSLRGGDARAARRDLEYSLKKDSGQSRAHNFLGVLALGSENTAEACAAFQQGCANGDCTFLEAARNEKVCP